MLLLILAGALVAYLLWVSTRKPDKFPPGPARWPLVGSLFYMKDKDDTLSLFHGARRAIAEYGHIFGLYIGSTPVVMVADLDVLRDLFKREELSSRPPIRPINELRVGHDVPELDGRAPGIIFSAGRYWRDQRRFVLRHLRDFGFGKSSMEGMLNAEVEKLCKMYQNKVGRLVVLNRSINASVINALWTILVGDSFQLDDPDLEVIVRILDKALQDTNPFSPVSQVLPTPSMAKLPLLKNVSGYANADKMFTALNEFIAPYVKDHLQSFQKDETPRDLMDLIIQENQDTTEVESPFYGSKGVASLTNIFIELFLAGMGTTTSSLVWTFLYIMHHPNVQKKVHEELDKVVGRDRLPSLTDQPDMPYINAVLHESLRLTSLAFNGLPHYTTAEVEVQGYRIPKDSVVFGCLYHIMNDPDHFSEPRVFRPERFIDEKTGAFVPSDRVIPFSVGKRVCLGQSLAEKEFFLFFAGIMQGFELRAPEGEELSGYGAYSTNPQGIQRIPPEVRTVMKSRIN